jgi:DNA-binding PadR family transcriptional regulator
MRAAKEPAPLKPAVFHILLALAERESHGYAIMQAVREQSGGHVPLRTGSFYRHLSGLIRDRLVVESPDRPRNDNPRRGAYYRLTARGHEALAAERARLSRLVAALDAVRPHGRRGLA